MIADDVSGAIAWGATWRQLLKPRSENPFPDIAGWYVKRKAWFFGYDNAVDVLSKSDGLSPDDPIYDDLRHNLELDRKLDAIRDKRRAGQ